ncbi:sensor histidine kinase [Hoyosella altamirensis]|uniref:histidine kinase n=1 Tax=Hoyosella altamirensis TaxID=616997 RepID=A0A839RN70_9ACTN|nr:histidine kinase [Hoyosella altamirensis]MBB3037950.1 signal transduction histidine kinase [Hoyosella altamirensis]
MARQSAWGERHRLVLRYGAAIAPQSEARGLVPAYGNGMGLASRVRANVTVWIDASLAVVSVILFVVAWSTLQLTHDVSLATQPVVAATTAAPLLAARRKPVLGFGAAAGWAVIVNMQIETLPGWHIPWQVVHVIVLMLLAGAVALQCRIWVSVVVWAVTVAVFDLTDGADGLPLGVTALMVVGVLLRSLVLSRLQLSDQERLRDEERERRIILEERARIARELHDVVAHQMSLVVVQAETAPFRLKNVPGEVRDEFTSIAGTARGALLEVRGLLGVLRAEDAVVQRAPQPGAQQLPELLASTKRAGVPLNWSFSGEVPENLSALTGMSLYRIVQEALANASRHAPRAPVRVQISYTDAAVEAVITNKLLQPLSGVPGNGIAGMNERAVSAGGTLQAGPTPKGGFEVRAELPITFARPRPA